VEGKGKKIDKKGRGTMDEANVRREWVSPFLLGEENDGI
jgi:hypothetical protein